MRLLAASLFVLLCACGQSGDLYLPDEPAPVTAPAEVSPVAPDGSVPEKDPKSKQESP